MHNVLVTGEGGQHDEEVKQSFLIGYSGYDGTIFDGSIDLYSNHFMQQSFIYAEENGYDMIVQSTSGMSSYINTANLHPTVKLFMPSGSNEFIETFGGNMQTNPIIVAGAGIDSNVTGYQIDFFSIDPIYKSNLSSFSNGYIAGQIAFISDYLEISINDARSIARLTASNEGNYNYYSGYGLINIHNAINSTTPVELVSFTGSIVDGSVLLKWETATELNNSGWEIERSFGEPDFFEKINFVEGAGTSEYPHNYLFKDKPNWYGNYLYRIRQIDFDGTFEYSSAISVEYQRTEKGNSYLAFYPNPFNPECTIIIDLAYDSDVKITAYNILGRQIAQIYSGELYTGRYDFVFDGRNLPSGTYLIVMQTERELITNIVTSIK